MEDPEKKINSLRWFCTSVFFTAVNFSGVFDILGEKVEIIHKCMWILMIISWVITVMYIVLASIVDRSMYSEDSYTDSDKSKQIIFYVPRTRHHYTQICIDMSHISKPIREEFVPVSKKLKKMYKMSKKSERVYKKYKTYKPYLKMLAKDVKSSVEPCDCVGMENKLAERAPILLELTDKLFAGLQEEHKLDLADLEYEKDILKNQQKLDAQERKARANSYEPFAATELLNKML